MKGNRRGGMPVRGGRAVMTSGAVLVGAAGWLGLGADCRAGTIDLGAASNYALLYEGYGNNTLQMTNVTVNGNVGVGNIGRVNLGGPGVLTGRLDFAAPNTGQLSGNNVSVSGGVRYAVADVASALLTVNGLSTALGGVNGTDVAIGGASMSLSSSSGVLASGLGFTNARFFDVTSYGMGNNSTLTIQGNGSGDAVVLNFNASTNFNGQVLLTGGLSPDQVVFNFVGGAGGAGGPTLQINNQGDGAHPLHNIEGVFLDPNGAISVTSARINKGRVLGGGTHDFQYVSGSSTNSPLVVPLPGAAAMGAAGLAGVGMLRRLERRRRA